MKQKNITWHQGKITKDDRHILNKHRSAVLWFTGLSGSGKSTISVELEKRLHVLGIHTYRLDGDNIRHGLNYDLGFSEEDRQENIRRIGEVSKLFADAGILTLTAFISPYRLEREKVRELLKEDYIEIYVQASLEDCEKRDPKGLYKKARKGEIKNFTGIDSPYEEPLKPEIIVNTSELSVVEAVNKIIIYLKSINII
ncbi:adenylyl-sulfate kinase [Rossellomorea sp. BNER]|uniref:adenylyl-sulfate kinase n=1 Tax=Rossellomorea sp. BNER TaxID=2962031 RepID=UPI003AF239CB|nr:adenylyl-sulfate kinase [Rossellomorea sp. BNER]